MADRHPAVAALLRFFEYEHLPLRLQPVSRPFSHLAYTLADMLPSNAETTTALRKLLESKDCAVRGALDDQPRPVVQDMAHDRAAQVLHLNVRIPGGLVSEAVADMVRDEVLEQLQRSAAEQSKGAR